MQANKVLVSTVLMFAAAARVSGNPTPDNPGAAASATDNSVTRQLRDDAWWTGPLLAASPVTLPQGHFLFEPYLFDAIPHGHYDRNGTRITGGRHSNNYGSQSYVLYGLVDRLTVGLIPRFGFNDPSQGRGSSGVGVGDLTLQASYGLTRFEEGGWIPSTAFVFQETLPAGKYDRLGNRPADGFGSGVYSTTLALYSQYFFWMPNGRILRTRFDISYSLAGSAPVRDVSVYGTDQGFQGRVRPGNSLVIDAAGEYSLTRNWVLAIDVEYARFSNTHLFGLDLKGDGSGLPPTPLELNSGPGHTWSLGPAIEYNFNSRVGIIAGAKLTVAGRNASAVIIPVAAINVVI